MGVVHRALDTVLQREVAIKRVRGIASTSAGRTALARLEQEALTLASLSHPNIVTIHDVVSEDGELHVVMELVVGRSLRSWLEQPKRTWQEIVSVFEKAGRGLEAAHAAGIIHRDFKPTNVMVGDSGAVVKVIDFGLARASEGMPTPSSRDSSSRSRSWTQGAGTLPYMAPEQRSGDTEAASDQYGFCVSLYEALTRERPFGGDEEPGVRTAADRQRFAQRLAEHGAPRRIRAAIVRGLGADPRARFTSMSALLARLAPPPARWAPWLVATAGACALMAAMVVRSDDPCELVDAAASEMWTAERRALVQQRGSGFERDVDRFVESWRERARSLCETQAAGSGEHQARERMCLQRSLARVDLFVAAVTDGTLSGDRDALFGEIAAFECDDSAWALITAPPGTFAAVDEETMRSVDAIYVQALAGDVAAQASLLAALVEQEATPARVRTWGLARLGHLHNMQGRYEQAAEILERALIEAEAADEPVLRGILQSELAAAVANLPGREAEAVGLARRALVVLEGTPAGKPHRAAAHGAVAVAAWRSGDPATAYAAAAGGLALLDARPPGSPAQSRVTDVARAQLLNLRGMSEEAQGRRQDAEASYREAVELIERALPRHADRARILNNLGLVERDLGRMGPAVDHLQQALALAREQGLATLAATSAMNLGNVMLAANRLEPALTAYDDARALLTEEASIHVRAELSYNRAIALQGLRRFDPAAQAYADALAWLASAPGANDVRYGAHLGRGLAHIELGQPELAQRDLTDALALEPDGVAPADAIDLRLGLAFVAPATERPRIATLVEQARAFIPEEDPQRARQLEAWRARFAVAQRWWPSEPTG